MRLRQTKSQYPKHRYSRTKIIATLGPATNNDGIVARLLETGVDGFRLNFSHGEQAEQAERINWVRRAAGLLERPVAIIQDLQGPKIRVGDLPTDISIEAGQTIRLGYEADYKSTGIIPIQHDISKYVEPNHHLLLNDGKIKTQIMSIRASVVTAEAITGGVLSSRKGINLPDTNLGGDILTAKDKRDLKFGVAHDIDYVALSFVQIAQDVVKLREILERLDSNAKIIAKIETKQATMNLEEIVLAADAVMVARGDLATETAIEAVPIIQREITGLCMKHGKVSIIATQMLASMTDAASPTRAEVSDVATAVINGVDGVMLSEETAIGQFPVETVKVMHRVIDYAEKHWSSRALYQKFASATRQATITSSVTQLAESLKAKVIVAETISGGTARSLAAHRPLQPIAMVASGQRVANQLAIVYGGMVFYRPARRPAAERITDWLKDRGVLSLGDVAVLTSGRQGAVGSIDTVKVRTLT